MNCTEHVSLPVESTLNSCTHFGIYSGDASLKVPLDITEYVGNLTSYTLTVTAINCNGQTAMVCTHMHVFVE